MSNSTVRILPEPKRRFKPGQRVVYFDGRRMKEPYWYFVCYRVGALKNDLKALYRLPSTGKIKWEWSQYIRSYTEAEITNE